MRTQRKGFLVALGTVIRRERLKRGWSQSRLADRADLTQKYVSEIESGKRNPTVDCVRRIGDGLGLSLTAIFRDVE